MARSTRKHTSTTATRPTHDSVMISINQAGTSSPEPFRGTLQRPILIASREKRRLSGQVACSKSYSRGSL